MLAGHVRTCWFKPKVETGDSTCTSVDRERSRSGVISLCSTCNSDKAGCLEKWSKPPLHFMETKTSYPLATTCLEYKDISSHHQNSPKKILNCWTPKMMAHKFLLNILIHYSNDKTSHPRSAPSANLLWVTQISQIQWYIQDFSHDLATHKISWQQASEISKECPIRPRLLHTQKYKWDEDDHPSTAGNRCKLNRPQWQQGSPKYWGTG